MIDWGKEVGKVELERKEKNRNMKIRMKERRKSSQEGRNGVKRRKRGAKGEREEGGK